MASVNICSLLRRHELARRGKTAARCLVVHNNFRWVQGPFRFPVYSVDTFRNDDVVGMERQLVVSPQLVSVIGKRMKGVPPSHVIDHVAGFCLGARITPMNQNIQHNNALYRIGPFLTTYEIPFDKGSAIQIWFASEGRKLIGSYGDMVWPLSHLLSVISEKTVLNPGDVIFPGSPFHDSIQQGSVSFGLGDIASFSVNVNDLFEQQTIGLHNNQFVDKGRIISAT